MPRVIIEVSGGVATVESSSDVVDVLFFDWDDLYERIGAERCAVIQDALYGGEYEKAQDLDECYVITRGSALKKRDQRSLQILRLRTLASGRVREMLPGTDQ